MKATEEFFFVILFIMPYKVVWMNSSRVTIKMKATKKNIQVLKIISFIQLLPTLFFGYFRKVCGCTMMTFFIVKLNPYTMHTNLTNQ